MIRAAVTSTTRVPCAAPAQTLTRALHQAWWDRIADQRARLHWSQLPHVRAATFDLMRSLVFGTAASVEFPVLALAALPMTREVAHALVAVLHEWQVPASVLERATAAVGEPQ